MNERPHEADSVNPDSALIVGRQRELDLLQRRLSAMLAGRGGVVLIGGEAGIGKTTLVDLLHRQAQEHGALVLTGGCYDLTSTPPYGPWREALAPALSSDLLDALAGASGSASVSSQADLFERVLRAVAALAEQQPLVLALEDLHWSDPTSLDLLRAIARDAREQRVLLIATYRAGEDERLRPVMPLLVRESAPERIDLRPLEAPDIESLVAARYALDARDARRLVAHLQSHAEGNPFFVGEMLHTLEAERLLRPTVSGWTLGDLAQAPVPALVRQIVESRLATLSDGTRQALSLAAVVGHAAPFDVLGVISGLDEGALLDAVEPAIAARLVVATPDGLGLRFVHALVRETVYEDILPPRRRTRHLEVAEALLAEGDPDSDTLAHHLQQAGDPRAVDWLVLAGQRASNAYAWATTVERFTDAARLMADDAQRAKERAWLLHLLGHAMRWIDPERGAVFMAESQRVAESVGERQMAAESRAYHGMLLCFTGKVRQGLPEMEQAVAEIDAIDPTQDTDFTGGFNKARGALALWLGLVGRVHDSNVTAEEVLDEMVRHELGPAEFRTGDWGKGDSASIAGAQAASACITIARNHALLGRIDEARAMFRRSQDIYSSIGHFGMVYASCLAELATLTVPLELDQPLRREEVAAAIAESWRQAQAAMPAELPPRATRLPLLVVEGDWADMRELSAQFRQAHGNVVLHSTARIALGTIARHQGDTELAWQQVREGLPHGPDHEPGDTEIMSAMMLQRLAVTLALDAGNTSLARDWLDAANRWLAWSGAVLGQADVELLWAMWEEQHGNLPNALERGERAVALAGNPRQPLALLSTQRFLGRLARLDGRSDDAERHLADALELADRCGAVFERALTLLELAELRVTAGAREDAAALLDDARSICERLGAKPALERIAAIEAALADDGLGSRHEVISPREMEVLRLLVEGRSNQEIGDALFISPHTVARHVASIMNKLGAESRTAAATYAMRHGLV
ncbi:MAG TPA: AAA family ATPase [Thermomicrobiales bacterium]|nr:AAA family ATPase [Thermomicrobiales bacterium]